MSEFKPCPFCGGKAKIFYLLGRTSIACTMCYAAMIPDYSEEKDFIVRAWNTRRMSNKEADIIEGGNYE